jgi:hypothetical protein
MNMDQVPQPIVKEENLTLSFLETNNRQCEKKGIGR